MQSQAYVGSLQFVLEDEPDKLCRNTDRPPVLLVLSNFSTPTVTSVVNGATLQPDFSPGSIITITGTQLTTVPPGKVRYDPAGLYPTRLADTTVYLNDKPIPLLYASPERIDAIIPHSFAGISTADLVVLNGIRLNESKPFRLTLQPTSPGIYTAEGIGGALGIYNQDGTPNGEDHPAPKGAEIQIRATGVGVWNENLPDGSIALSSVFFPHYLKPLYPEVILRPKAPVSLTIGGQAANILNMGPVPYEIFGTLNLVAAIPDGLSPGPHSIVLKVGDNDNAGQNVIVWVR
jgi:uncharacterized protein (TIGR03437 family)